MYLRIKTEFQSAKFGLVCQAEIAIDFLKLFQIFSCSEIILTYWFVGFGKKSVLTFYFYVCNHTFYCPNSSVCSIAMVKSTENVANKIKHEEFFSWHSLYYTDRFILTFEQLVDVYLQFYIDYIVVSVF